MSRQRTGSDAGNTGKLFSTALVLLLLLLLLLLFLYLLAISSGDHPLGSTLGNTAGRAAGAPWGGPAPKAGSIAAANAQSVCSQSAFRRPVCTDTIGLLKIADMKAAAQVGRQQGLLVMLKWHQTVHWGREAEDTAVEMSGVVMKGSDAVMVGGAGLLRACLLVGSTMQGRSMPPDGELLMDPSCDDVPELLRVRASGYPLSIYRYR